MAFLFGGFSKTKLAEALVGAPARIQLRHSKKKNEISRNKKQVATYLKDKQFDRARIYVESLIRDERKVEAEEIICLMCELLRSRVDYLNGERQCPPEALESVHTIIFSARLTDIDELKAAAQQFKYKYGDEFFEVALRDKAPHSRVNEKIKNRLGMSPASAELIAETLAEIAKANSIPFDPVKDLASSEIGLARVPESAGKPGSESGSAGGAAGPAETDGKGGPDGSVRPGEGGSAAPENGQGMGAMSALLPAGQAPGGSTQPAMLFYDPMSNVAYVSPGQMPAGGVALPPGALGQPQGQALGQALGPGMLMMGMPGGHTGPWAAQGIPQQGGSQVVAGIPAGYPVGYAPQPGSDVGAGTIAGMGTSMGMGVGTVPVAMPVPSVSVGMPPYAQMHSGSPALGGPMLMPSYAATAGAGYPPHLPSAMTNGQPMHAAASATGHGGPAGGPPVLPGGYSYGGLAAGLQDYPPTGTTGSGGGGAVDGGAGARGGGMDADGYPIKPKQVNTHAEAAQGRGGGGPLEAGNTSDPSSVYEDHVDREKARLRLLEEQAQRRLASDMAHMQAGMEGLHVAGGPGEGAAAGGATAHKAWPGEQGQPAGGAPPTGEPSETSASAAPTSASFAARLAALKKT